MSSLKFQKAVNLTSKAILSGQCYQCFNRNTLSVFLDSIHSSQASSFFLYQSKFLILLSWYLHDIPLKQLIVLESKDFKITRHHIEVRIPGSKKTVIPLFLNGQEDSLATKLHRYIRLGIVLNGSFRYFKELQSTYIDCAGYKDLTRKLRYHLRQWLRNYNTKVESAN
jgi:hypothetical protein